jgi:hypothetical protein
VRELRLVLATTSELLADLIQHVVSSRIEAAGYSLRIVAIVADAADLADELVTLKPDVVIVGQRAAGLPNHPPGDFPSARVVTLSATLEHIVGPREGEVALLTPAALAARMLDIARKI